MGFEQKKIATFPRNNSCPRNQPSAPEEPVLFPQVEGRVSLSIGSTAPSPPPGRNAAWSVSQMGWIFITCPSGNWLRGTFVGCRSFCRSESRLIKPSV